ncbi:MAG: Flp family type IVb pilin [Streptosporangiaceae bacterium]
MIRISPNWEGNLMLKCFSFMQNFLADRLSGDRGATAVEYGLLVALIAGAIIAVVATLGTTIAGWFTTVRAGF